MKILIDEKMPRSLGSELIGHEAETTLQERLLVVSTTMALLAAVPAVGLGGFIGATIPNIFIGLAFSLTIGTLLVIATTTLPTFFLLLLPDSFSPSNIVYMFFLSLIMESTATTLGVIALFFGVGLGPELCIVGCPAITTLSIPLLIALSLKSRMRRSSLGQA